MHIQQISDEGTSNSIVARLLMQTKDLLPYYDLKDGQREQVFAVMFSDILPNLLACSKTASELDRQVKARQKEIDEKRGLPIVGGRAVRLPSVPDLRPRVEAFLYQAKSVLRDLTKLFRILFGKKFDAARFDLVVKWAKKRFGEEHELVRMLRTDLEWTKRVVDMRNAVEHPDGYSGRLHIRNFTVSQSGRAIDVTEPTWFLNDEEPCSISSEMLITSDNLLTLCEQTLFLVSANLRKIFQF
jgi:hypothetical protein